MTLRARVRSWLGVHTLVNQQSFQTEFLGSTLFHVQRRINEVHDANHLVAVRMVEEFAQLKEILMRNMEAYNSAIAELTARVSELKTVEDSAVALISGLRERINQLITESDGIVPVEELQKLSSSIDVGTRKLADAVAANTAPEPVAAPQAPPATEEKPVQDAGTEPKAAE